MATPTADEIVAALGLAPHPEGGFYRETYRASDVIPREALPPRYAGARAASTAIYFLLRRGEISALHRIASDELWFFHLGAPLTVHVLAEDGTHQAIRLGHDLAGGESPQAMVPAGAHFGARIEGGGDYALVSCTVAPGFDFADFELPARSELLARFPEHQTLVMALTRAASSGPADGSACDGRWAT